MMETKRTLKYANVAKVGDRIRAYDFQPMPDRPDRFVEGIVLSTGRIPFTGHFGGFDGYEIEVTANQDGPQAYGEIVDVPHETSFDWDGRVVKL